MAQPPNDDLPAGREGLLRSLFRHSLNGIALHRIVTDDDGRPVDYVFLEVNPAFERITGLTADEVVGRRVTDVLPGIEHEPRIETYARVAETGEPVVLDAQPGEALGRSYQVAAFRTGPGRFATVFSDVTALRESEATLRALTESSPDHVMMLDLDGTIRFINRTVSGLTEDEVVGRPVFEFVPDEPARRMRAAFRRVVRTGQPDGYSIEYHADDGEVRYFESRVGPVVRDGEVVGLVMNASDVTERKELEAQLRQSQKMEAVGRLAGGIAHDFNNLLTGIQGYTELLAKTVAEETARRDLEHVRTLSQRAAELTRQLLAFSRRQRLEPEVLDLNELVRTSVSMLRRTLGEDLRLQLALADESLHVRADAVQLEQVLLNLAVNARDALPDGGTLGIRTMPSTDEPHLAGEAAVLEVWDDGEGMDERTRERIFEPFFTTKEVGKGTGLGLSTVYGIVRQHGGRIRCDSARGSGTTFRVALPAVDPEVPTEPEAPPVAGSGGATCTILLVEDEGSVRDVAERILARYGFPVYAAEDPREAESLFESHGDDIDLLMTDVVMPGIDGVELFRRLRRRKPSLEVLYISGYAEKVLEHEDPDVVRDRFLRKPFDAEALVAKIRRILAGEI